MNLLYRPLWHKLLIHTQLKEQPLICMSIEESVVNQISYCNSSGNNWLNMLFEDDTEGGEQVPDNQDAIGTGNQDA